jgi:hypothetical protein
MASYYFKTIIDFCLQSFNRIPPNAGGHYRLKKSLTFHSPSILHKDYYSKKKSVFFRLLVRKAIEIGR